MSVKVDVERSFSARADGNASFKKGRWTEAIGHYTTAIVFNPQEGLAYTNRAAAYLKIEKWKDAERDCSTAISLDKGDENVKALYRRSLARKALQDLEGAIEDIETVLRIEPTNETAREELGELEELRRKVEVENEARKKKAKALPPSPPRSPAPALSAVEPSESLTQTTNTADVAPSVSAPAASASRGSFADLKKDRLAGRKTYAAPPTVSTPALATLPTNDASHGDDTVRATSPSSLPLESVRIGEITVSPTQARAPLQLLDPTVPGSAISLMTAIRNHPASQTYPLLADLAKRPAGIGKMLDNFLEPDQLALILARLQETLNLDPMEKEERGEVVRGFMSGLRMTRRWAMTAIMLSAKEKQLGHEVWTSAGGSEDWTKGS